jgi:hypothetical protein
MSDNIYLGNPNLKRANTQIEFTEEQIYEYLRFHLELVRNTK